MSKQSKRREALVYHAKPTPGKIQVVPVLVVDSVVSGVYDTIIPDLSTSWMDYSKNEIKFDKKFAPATKTIPASKNTMIASDPILSIQYY